MTPLAHWIIKDMVGRPASRRAFIDNGEIVRKMSGIHCFECTDIAEAAFALWDKWVSEDFDIEQLSTNFLPAERVWLEYQAGDVERRGLLISDNKNGTWEISFAVRNKQERLTYSPPCSAQLSGLSGQHDNNIGEFKFNFLPGALDETEEYKESLRAWAVTVMLPVYAMLAFINTPKVIGRLQHMPHRGLERALLAQQKVIGKFPLHAWTEIKLHVTPPRDASGEGSHEAHLTGRKALHFCRSHLRIANGQLVLVRGHWRGDASLGIKRSRYVVKVPKEQA